MLENFVIVHHSNLENALPLEGLLQWKTCLRAISLGFLEPAPEESSVFVGTQAYNFLLEVVCGLHSPIVGETEVMGQFKKFVEENAGSSKPRLKRVFTQILTDAKVIRRNLLRDIGSRSYGSLLRKYVKDAKHVTVLGAGHLAQEILPWLKTTPKVNLICRDIKRGQDLREQFKFVEINDMTHSQFGEAIIIAAKISTQELRDFICEREEITKIIDLRENSTRDPLNLVIPTLTLKQLFSEIEACEKTVQAKIIQAKKIITEHSQKHFHAAELRPFGWEDLCG